MPDIDEEDSPDLLLVDDDPVFCRVLSDALRRRGYAVRVAGSVPGARDLIAANPPELAVIDLKMPGPSGLELVSELKALDEHTRIVVLTGYASIATAVEAIKLGALYYLAKPADADEIVAAFRRDGGDTRVELPSRPLSLDRLEWEHIQRVLFDCQGNVSAAARSLGLHRRTLQRKLNKRPVSR